MASAPNDNSLSSDRNANQFLVYTKIEPWSLIQPLKILLVELTRIYIIIIIIISN